MVCSDTITERRHKVRQQIQVLGFYLAGFLCLVLAVLKLTIEGHWSWWRVLLPLSVVLGHNALYITVGFVWLFFADDGAAGEEVTIRQDDSQLIVERPNDVIVMVFGKDMFHAIPIEAFATSADVEAFRRLGSEALFGVRSAESPRTSR